jgi:hypothetical protein
MSYAVKRIHLNRWRVILKKIIPRELGDVEE